jgi:eukaryotic-like serine/threonine-protein kinase
MTSTEKRITISIPVRKFWKLYVPITIIVLILSAGAGIFFIDVFILPRISGIDRDLVEVPAVTGVLLEQGREKLFAAGLLTEIRSREYDNAIPEEGIISQSPERGEKVKKGRRILVVVSKGKEFAVIPNVKDLTEHQARVELKKQGFTIGDAKKTFDAKHPVDAVIDANPQCGATISRDMKVDLIISKGPKPTSAEMPNIVGESLADARKKIEESGLAVGKIDYRNDPSVVPGTVITQSVSPGEKVPLESKVGITVSVRQ